MLLPGTSIFEIILDYWSASKKVHKAILLYGVMACLSGCKDERPDANATGVVTGDSVVTSPKDSKIVLRELTVDSKFFDHITQDGGKSSLGQNNISLLGIVKIDSVDIPQAGFKYYIDTLAGRGNGQVILILRAYPEENIGWVASYDEKGRLINHAQVYYDNAEGSFSMSSEIKKDSIIVTSLNDYGETPAEKSKTATYFFDTNKRIIMRETK